MTRDGIPDSLPDHPANDKWRGEGSKVGGDLACRLSCRSHDGWGKKPTAGPTALSSKPKAADLDPECSFLPPELYLLPPSRHPLPDPQRPEHRPCQPFPVTAFVFFHFPSSYLYWILGQANHTSLDQKVRTPTYSFSLLLVIHQKSPGRQGAGTEVRWGRDGQCLCGERTR